MVIFSPIIFLELDGHLMEQDIQMQRQPFASQAGRTLFCLKKTFVLGYGKKCRMICEYLKLDSSVLAIGNTNFKAF